MTGFRNTGIPALGRGLLVAATAVLMGLMPHAGAAAADSAKIKVIVDNDRVLLREIETPVDQPIVVSEKHDAIVIGMKAGDVKYTTKGTAARLAGAHDPKSMVIELKDFVVQPIANNSGQGPAFPRPRVKKVLENARVVIWDYTWLPNEPTPKHFHDKDVVITYFADGAIKSIGLDGAETVNKVQYGLAKFNPRDRAHHELLAEGSARAVIVELK
jgi:hypothetical protein